MSGHVLYLLRYYPTLTETFVHEEIRAVQAAGWRVTVAALGTRDDGATSDRLPDVPVLRVPRRPLAGRLRAPTVGQQALRDWQRAKDAARLPWLAERIRDVDRVHVHFAGEAAEWAWALRRDGGPPYTVTTHAVDVFRPRPSLLTVLQGAEAVLTVADHHVAHLAARGVSARRVRCGPDLARWALPPAPAAPLQALFVGRDVPKKGLDPLLDAWRPDPGEALHVVSDRQGPPRAGVIWHGPLPPAGVRDVLARCHLAVLPCRRGPDGDQDGVPLALMEALAARRPAITTAVSGIPELIDEAVGWLVPPDDPAALHGALAEARIPGERGRRGAAGPERLRARGFTLADQVAGLLGSWSVR